MQLYSGVPRRTADRAVHLLLDLPPALMAAYEQGALVLRSDEDGHRVVACTADATYLLSCAPQNPTVLLAGATAEPRGVTASGVVEKRLEPTAARGEIPWDTVAVYHNGRIMGRDESQFELRSRSLCSDAEFDVLWTEKAAFELEGRAAIPHPDVIYDTLCLLVATLIAENLGLSGDCRAAYREMDASVPFPVVEAVYNKFWEDTQLDAEAMVVWVGKHKLRALPKEVGTQEFVAEWSQELPLRGVQYDLGKLSGSFVESHGTLRHLELDSLPRDPKSRFKALFVLKPCWRLDEISPYLQDIAHGKMKLEAWIKRYARLQEGSAKLVRPRRA